jgi:hypothetical protein
VSEYQYYEFLALDRPLSTAEQAEVRQLSTRARITATSFTNEYHWGDFRGSPDELMRRYYDAHLYFANWGTHRVMFRLPRAALARAHQSRCRQALAPRPAVPRHRGRAAATRVSLTWPYGCGLAGLSRPGVRR